MLLKCKSSEKKKKLVVLGQQVFFRFSVLLCTL